MKAPVLLLWTFLLVVLGLSLARPHAMLSPAALTTAHADLERDCLACHDPHGGPAAPALSKAVPGLCTECHDGASEDMKSKHRTQDVSAANFGKSADPATSASSNGAPSAAR